MAADPLMFYPAAPNRPPSDPSADDPRKVKFLCSFGGQIIPRPSDGALRYAGGQTRIISVRRDAPLPEIMNKMAEVFGGHAALRYQLPDVDLDALVSVSSPEDLENMMEEYDKIAEAAPDGSAKLRVFLFSPSDLAADPASLLDLEDYSQRYVEAVNRISSDGSLRRKDSLASASSAHNSGGGINGGTSPEILSPTAAAANDSSRLFFVGAPSPPAGFPDPPVLPANPPVAASNSTTSRVELSPYTSQPYADPNQFQYMNSQPMGTPPGSLPISPLAIPQPQYQYAPVASHVGTDKSVPAVVDSYGGRTTQLHGDPNSRAGNQLVSQLLPVPPPYLQPQNVELYGVRQAVPPPMQGQGYRLEDCYMCHKALPHAHSDTQVQEHGSATSEASTTFHSLRAEDATRLGTPNRVIAPPTTENKVAAGPFVSYGFAPIPEVRYDNEKLVVPNVVSDHSSALRPPATMGLPSDTQASSGMFVNVPQYRREDSLQKQQQQSLVQPQPMVKQDGIVELYRNGVYPVKNENLQAIEALNLGHVPEFPSNYPGPLEGMMETLRVSPFDNLVYNEERKPTVSPNLVISKELKPEKVPLVEINHPVRPQVGGNTSFMGSGFRNPGIKQEGSYARPVDQLLTSSLGLTQSQNLQPTVSSQVSTQETFFFNHETGREPMVHSKVLHAMPAYSCSINPVQTNNNTNTVPDGDQKDEASRYSKDMLGDFAAPTSIKFPFPFPNSIRPTQQVELFDEPILPDSLFPSQDPIKISGGTNFLPPRPIRVASRESIIAKDLSTENLSIANQGPDIALLLDDNVFYQPSNSLIKDPCREPVARGTRGSEDEKINKELQAVAEGAATAVLQSSVPPIPVFVARETKGSTSQFNIGVIDDITSLNNTTFLGDYRVEDTKSKPAENLNSGFLIGDEIGRLQIIKNSDLEELKELGSGTFGTVYHGKWRGSDVAIKRINNRCFAGKPSEQERTRADFWNEASKLSDLHHPNVVAFYGVVVDGPGGSVATVTEYMVNGSLRQALQKNDKTFDRSKRLLIAMDVAFGMEYLHSKNIVHFDLKSDNLLVNLRDPQRPICKVGDLGLSKVKCQTLISGGVRGTLPWMAPELLNGSSSLVSEKVDVFSFGIVMWEILTGKEPYADMHYGAIIGGIVSNTLRPPVPETCELDWRSLMERCWSSEPSERPSFTEIASGLRAMAASPSSKGR